MYNENIVRKMDSMGRIAVPKSLRDRYGMEPGNYYPIFTFTDKNGRVYVCAQTDTYDTTEAENAVKVLEKMGCEIPEELMDVVSGEHE